MTMIRSPSFIAQTLSTLLIIGMFRNTAGFGSTLAFVKHPTAMDRKAFTVLSSEKDEESEFVYSRRKRGRRNEEDDLEEDSSFYKRTEKESYLDDEEDDYDYDVQDEFDEEYDDDDDWDDEEEDNDLFGNDIIPNPILDSMDPDGAAERFPELARDPRFWFDMLLFVTFLDLVSIIGPRDPYPDIPWL